VSGPVALVHEPPAAEGEPFPTEMAVPPVLQPAATLLALYGRPGHDELNPMLVVVAATPFLFGMMFGDVGYGLLLGVVALVCRRRLRHWLAPVLSCSLASVIFGFLYGSVFGVEDWLPALWLRPMEEPFRLLAFSLGVGVVLLLLTFVLKASTLLRQGRREEALSVSTPAPGPSSTSGRSSLLGPCTWGKAHPPSPWASYARVFCWWRSTRSEKSVPTARPRWRNWASSCSTAA
jgi:vacuolar-type H+-ATPase subunit I/STV1